MSEVIENLLKKRSKIGRALTKVIARQTGGYSDFNDKDFIELSQEFGFKAGEPKVLAVNMENLIEDIDKELESLKYKIPFWRNTTYRDRDN